MKSDYFSNYSNVTINETYLKNIFKKIKVLSESDKIYEYYSIDNNSTPESLALQYYGDSKYYWLIMSTNLNMDYFYDFGMNQKELSEYITLTYETDKKRLYVNDQWVYETEEQYTERLLEENENKKIVRILKPKYASQVINS